MKRLTTGIVAVLCAASLCFLAGCSKKTAQANSSTLNAMIEVEVETLDPQTATDGTSFEVIADFTDEIGRAHV